MGGRNEKNSPNCSFEFCLCPFDRLCCKPSQDCSTSFKKRNPTGKTWFQPCLDTGTLEVDRRTLRLGIRALDKSQAWKGLDQRALEKERASVRMDVWTLEVEELPQPTFFVFARRDKPHPNSGTRQNN